MDIREKTPARHLGRKVSRIRELLGVKQESLAEKLGISQQAVSKLEQSEQIEDATLEKIASALGVRSEAIKQFNEDTVISIIANTITNNDQSSVVSFNPIFNPMQKWVEAIEENKRLYEELLKSHKEKIELLEVLLKRTS